MQVGCYVLDLYCDNPDCPDKHKTPNVQYTDELGSRCLKQARKDGWKLTTVATRNSGKDLCPKCNGKR